LVIAQAAEPLLSFGQVWLVLQEVRTAHEPTMTAASTSCAKEFYRGGLPLPRKAVLDKVLKAGICGTVERKGGRQRFRLNGFSGIDQPKLLGIGKRLVPGSKILVSLFIVRFDVCVCSRIRTCDGYLDIHAFTPL
jgi:hypothetical protein